MKTGSMNSLLSLFLLSFICLLRQQHSFEVKTEKWSDIAKKYTPRKDYEIRAKELMHIMLKNRKATKRDKILCYTSMAWNPEHTKLLQENLWHSRDFCSAWHFIILSGQYDKENPKDTNQLYQSLNKVMKDSNAVKPFTVSRPIPKKGSVAVYIELCHQYIATYLPTATFTVHPCEMITDVNMAEYNPQLYSKGPLYATLLDKLPHFEYAWLLDSDLTFEAMNFTEYKRILEHGFQPGPPLVSQPLIHPSTQSDLFLNRGSWAADGTILAAEVGFIEMQAPFINAEYLEWFIVGVLMPMIPLYQYYGTNWALDYKYSLGAVLFKNAKKQLHQQDFVPCGIVISSMHLMHHNTHLIKKDGTMNAASDCILRATERHFPFNEARDYFHSSYCTIGKSCSTVLRIFQ